MSQQIYMSLVSLILALIFLAGFLGYRYFFPKKKINYLWLLILLSLLPCVSIFRTGPYESGDFVYHLYRAMAFSDALKDGILIPSWAANLNGTYGYPVFIFIYNTPYYILSLLNFIGFSFIFSEKLLLTFTYVGSGLLMYAVLKKLTKNDFAAFIGSVVYLFTPYHLVDMHFRVSIAELIGFVLAPAAFYVILKLQEENKLKYIMLLGLLLGILLLDHPAQFIFYSGLFAAYILYTIFLNKKNVRLIIPLLISFFLSLLISSYAWISRFTLSKYTYGSQLMHFPVSYVQPAELLFSPWRLGLLFQGHYGELSYVFGYTQWLVLVFAIYLLLKNKITSQTKKQLLFWVITTVILLFCMLSYSKLLWDIIPFLSLMQFSYRLLHPLVFCIAIVTAYLALEYKNKKILFFFFLVITIGYTILNWGNRGMLPNVTDATIRKDLITSTSHGEGMIEGNPIWYSPKTYSWITTVPKNHLEIIKGQGQIEEIKRTTTEHTYITYLGTQSTLLENTFYFPNWKITVDKKPVAINYQTKQYPGRMIFSLSKGVHYIDVTYNDIPALQIAKEISIATVIGVILSFFLL